MSTPVKWFTSDMAGAPVLSGTAGALIAVLDACLVTGFNTKTLTSLVVSGGVATATVALGHGFVANAVVLIAGATPAALNGEACVSVVSANVFTFPTTAPDGPATGTITAKLAPAGWSKAFSGSNKAVYRADAVDGRRFYYRVDDTGTYDAPLRGYRTMTDVDTGATPFPASDTVRLAKLESGAGPAWVCVADPYGVYLWVSAAATSAPNTGFVHGFGDLGRLTPSDAYCSYIAGWEVAAQNGKSTVNAALGGVRSLGSALPTAALPSGWAGETSINAAAMVGDGLSGGWSSGLSGPAYPAPHGGALLVPLHLVHGGAPRGRLRGLYALANASGWAHRQVLDLGDGRSGLVVQTFQSTGGGGQAGALVVALDAWEAP